MQGVGITKLRAKSPGLQIREMRSEHARQWRSVSVATQERLLFPL